MVEVKSSGVAQPRVVGMSAAKLQDLRARPAPRDPASQSRAYQKLKWVTEVLSPSSISSTRESAQYGKAIGCAETNATAETLLSASARA
jgi:hypothetical protein